MKKVAFLIGLYVSFIFIFCLFTVQDTLKDKHIEKIQTKEVETTKEVYNNYWDLGVTAGVELDFYLNKNSNGDIKFEENQFIFFKESFIKEYELKNLNENQKKGLIEGLDFVWKKRLKDRFLEKDRTEIRKISMSILEDINNLPVSEK